MTPAARRGFALITTLGVLAVLTTIVLSFGHRAVLERRAAAISIDRTQVLYLARGAAMRGSVELRNKNVVDMLRGQGERTGFDQRWYERTDLFEGDSAIFELGGPIETEDEECYYQIVDAESRVCINTAPEELLAGLEASSLGTVRKIMLRRETSFRSTTERRPRAYLSVDEFRQLENIRDDEWYGTRGRKGLRDVITVYGSGRININTASREVLEAVPGLDRKIVDAIVEYRSGGEEDEESGAGNARAFDDIGQVVEQLGLSASVRSSLNRFCTTVSEYFTISAVATQRQGAVRAQVTATVQLGETSTKTLEWREDLVGY